MSIKAFDDAARPALSNLVISESEAGGLAAAAKKALASSRNPAVTRKALFGRFQNWARNKYIQDPKAVRHIAAAVQKMSGDTKTFTALGIRNLQRSGAGTPSRVRGGESSGRVRGGESSGRVRGGESSGRVRGGESSVRIRVREAGGRIRGGESTYSPYASYARIRGGER